MEINLTNTLLETQNPNHLVRQQAENLLKNLENNDFKNYIDLLCNEMGGENKPNQAVQLAGILLKNAVDAKSAALRSSLRSRWFAIPLPERVQIHNKMLALICSPNKLARQTASLVVAKLAVVELPANAWPDLGDSLLAIASKTENSDALEGALKTLSYLCEEVPDYVRPRASALFEIACKLCAAERPNDSAKAEAFVALYQGLLVAQSIFENDAQRNFVLQVIFNALEQKNEALSVVAFDCLARSAELYYSHLHGFIADVLKITSSTLASLSTPLSVRLRAFEFWACLSEIEGDLQAEAVNALTEPRVTSQGFVARSLPGLVPLLLDEMTRQKDGDFDDAAESGSAPAAAACLQLAALCTKDALVAHLIPFLRENLNANDWHHREAAVCALGVLMEGPDAAVLGPIVSGAFHQILKLSAIPGSEGPAAFERDTSTWTLARICRKFANPLMKGESQLTALLKALVERLADTPKVAANCCWALHSLAEAIEIGLPHNALTPFFDALISSLLDCSKRNDRDEHHLLFCCYETINALISTSALESRKTVIQLANFFSSELERSFAIQDLEQVKINNFQALLISSLSSITKILPDDSVEAQAENLMATYLNVLRSKDKTIFEEVLIAVGVIIAKVERKFAPFLDQTSKFVLLGIGVSLGADVCQVAVGIVGDIFHAFKSQLPQRLSDEFVQRLLQTFQDTNVEPRVKPIIITCFGDIAISIGEGFDRYMDHVMKVLIPVSEITLDSSMIEMADLQNNLRRSLFETYSMILQSLTNATLRKRFFRYARPTAGLLERLSADKYKDASSLAAALAFLGDLLDVLGAEAKPVLNEAAVRSLIKVGRAASSNEAIKKALEWVESANESLSLISV